jgi:hypothetical protein
VVFSIIDALGLGGELAIAATLAVVAWYAIKAVSLAGTVGSAAASGVSYVVAALVAVGAAIAFGWVDPQPGAFFQSIKTWARTVWDAVGQWALDRATEVVG